MHEYNSFITLTYEDKHLPDDYSVQLRTLQLFMKRLRKHEKGKRIRFFGCGEYGDQTLRPHYHALLFGHDFTDKKVFKKTDYGPVFTSEILDKIWGFGYCSTAAVNYKTASYVARYVLKKITGDRADDHYLRLHPNRGTLHHVGPEFATQSVRPGLGTSWFNKFKSDAFPSDFVVLDGTKMAVPRFYTKKLAEEEQLKIKRQRKRSGLKRKPDQTPARLRVREEIKQSQISVLQRKLG
ncbi:MAG: replication initiator protein [Microvirus sp.]|nr:MAG: replication initiator protein [Microvirus sp.]